MIAKFVIWALGMLGVLVLASMFLPASFARSVLFSVAGIAVTGYLASLVAAGTALAIGVSR